jgi:predicted nuclease of restriction endonuclease-like (RecB) superfamily
MPRHGHRKSGLEHRLPPAIGCARGPRSHAQGSHRRRARRDAQVERRKVNKSAKATEIARPDDGFDVIVRFINVARQRAFQAVNTALIDLYWQIGEHISARIEAAEWGDAVVDRLAAHIARAHLGLRGFTRPNLFRMRQFYEAYASAGVKVSALLRQIPWTHHLMILGQAKRPEEREFYLQLVAREKWSSRQLERQLKLALFERAVAQPPTVSAALRQAHPNAVDALKDTYVLEFLGLPAGHSEADLHAGLLHRLRDFLIELGRDFCFVGSEFPVQVGGREFALDLLFFHRGLNCLVAIELKVGRFEPEYLGKLSFYVEALDRDVREPHENPPIGVLLCS